MNKLELVDSVDLLKEYVKREAGCDDEMAEDIVYELYPRLDAAILDSVYRRTHED